MRVISLVLAVVTVLIVACINSKRIGAEAQGVLSTSQCTLPC
jgi:hypothetical protein